MVTKPWPFLMIRFHGSKNFASHHIDNKPGNITIQKADTILVPIDAGEPLKNECQHFFDYITENKRPITDGQEALNVLKVLTTASES